MYFTKKKLYICCKYFCDISAWLQVDKGSADIRLTVKTVTGFVAAGSAMAKESCWSFLKGGFTVKTSGPAEIYFEVIKDSYLSKINK
jgi:hypothetical protein